VGKNVAVFVDVANIFYAAKAAGVDIDYVTLLKSATAGRDFVRAYAYTGLDPENENQRNFHSFLARNHYKVVSKDIRKYGDGKVKANLDIELVVDLMKTARNLDIAIVVSGDGDFAPAIRAVQEMGVRVEVISFRGNTSSDLIDVADLFTDITQLARVDKSSSRSGRRVAGDEEDLSMTEVPDKQTEGTGTRGRGRGRGRSRSGEAEVAASSRGSSRGASRGAAVVAASANGGGSLTVLPGEKLSRVASGAGDEEEAGVVEEDELQTIDEREFAEALAGEGEGEAGRRRRRRRGGRGRGRGRGRAEDGFAEEAVNGAAGEAQLADAEAEEEAPPAPRGPRTTPFGSFWDSQLGVPSAARGPVAPVGDDEDFEEPEIPEYLIAEQRRGRQQQQQGGRGGRGGRGARSAYASAIERERFGRGGGSSGINRYPDVSGRDRQGGGGGQRGGGRDAGYGRHERADRPERAPRPSGGDPWSEVPPELEEVLRAQLAQSGKGRPSTPAGSSRAGGGRGTGAETTPVGAASDAAVVEAAPAEPKRRTTRRTTAAAPAAAAAADTVAASEAPAPKRRTTRKTTAAGATPADTSDAAAATAETPAPKRRTTRKTAAASATAGEGASSSADAAAAPKRRTTRKKAEPA
jgi:uncharacterized LabA/DUF88 family protein